MRQARRCWCSLRSEVCFLVAASLLVAGPASAQRADENAVTAASDAFGTVVGNQTIGLYSPSNARGFSPTQAENLRIEGLYYDQQTLPPINPYLFKGSDMRVGIAAQSYAQWKSLSSRVETSDDRYSLPPLATLNVGVRYMFELFHRPSSVRLDVGNVTNATGVMLSSDYFATSQLRRNYTATVASDL